MAIRGLLLTFLLVVPNTSQAQDDEGARVHFESGRQYFAEGEYERALQEFQGAYRLSPRPGLLYNIAQCYERLGQYEQAADHIERYVRENPDEESGPTLLRRAANLRERARAAQTAAASGRPPPSASAPLPDHGSPERPSSQGDESLILGGVIALSIGGAALISYAIFGGLALSEQSSIENGCYATRTCMPEDVAAMDTYALVADISWPIGLAAAGAGAVLLALGLTSSAGESSAALRLAPFFGANEAGAFARGSF